MHYIQNNSIDLSHNDITRSATPNNHHVIKTDNSIYRNMTAIILLFAIFYKIFQIILDELQIMDVSKAMMREYYIYIYFTLCITLFLTLIVVNYYLSSYPIVGILSSFAILCIWFSIIYLMMFRNTGYSFYERILSFFYSNEYNSKNFNCILFLCIISLPTIIVRQHHNLNN